MEYVKDPQVGHTTDSSSMTNLCISNAEEQHCHNAHDASVSTADALVAR